jgi:hypothetical protein
VGGDPEFGPAGCRIRADQLLRRPARFPISDEPRRSGVGSQVADLRTSHRLASRSAPHVNRKLFACSMTAAATSIRCAARPG